jgi:hypothetical protein
MNRLFLITAAALTLGSSAQLLNAQPSGSANPLGVLMMVPANSSSHSGLIPIYEPRPFRSGERFCLNVTSRQEGYIYAVYVSSQGSVSMLYPFAEDGDNRVRPGENRSLPARGWFRFDEDPGKERVYVFESPERLADLEAAASSGGDLPASVLLNYLRVAEPSKGAQNYKGIWRELNISVRRIDLDHVSR